VATANLKLGDCGETLSTSQGSAVLGVSEALLREMIRQHRIHALKCGRIYRIPKRSIEKLLEGGAE
jgi:excisionase family DNA binding protein